MAEIFFIASDERALDLIESLRIQSQKSLTFETDLPSAVRRLPKEKPRYVFIQSSLDGTSCEEIAAQATELVSGPPPQLVLLRDEETPPGACPACFGYSVDLTLPTPDLAQEVMQLLDGEAPSEAPKAPVSDLSDLFTLEDAADFEIPSFDDAAFDPHLAPLWQPEQGEKGIIFDDILPSENALPQAAPPVTPAAPRDSRRHEHAEAADEIVFFVPEPSPAPEAEPLKETVSLEEAEPPKEAEPLKARASSQKTPPPQAPEAAKSPDDAAKGSKGSNRSLYPGPEQIYRKPPQLCGTPLEGEEEASPEETVKPASGRSGRYLSLACVLLLAVGALFWLRTPPSGPDLAPKTPLAPPAAPAKPTAATPMAPTAKPAPVAAAQPAQGLPAFIAKAPADPAYAAKHPGWERYLGDKMEFRIFREKGAVKAIQVVGQEDAAISETLVRTSFKETTGSDLPAASEATHQNGVTVETRKAKDGAEVAVYRGGDNGRILGFVLQLAGAK